MRARSFPIVFLSFVAAAPALGQMLPPEEQCPAPTVDECYSNPDKAGSYFQSECGQQQLWGMSWDAQSACNQIITERAGSQRPASRPGLAAVPAGMPLAGAYDQARDYIAAVDVVPYDPAADPVKVGGGVGTYAGGRLRLDVSASSSTTLDPSVAQSAQGIAASATSSSPTISATSTSASASTSAASRTAIARASSVGSGTTSVSATAASAASTAPALAQTPPPNPGAQDSIDANSALPARISEPRRVRDEWDANDNRVDTCEEYVYERYYDYSRYEDRVAALGTNYRAIFAEGYSALVNGVQSRTRRTVAKVPENPEPVEKNLFFTFRPNYPEGTAPYQFHDPDLLARLELGRKVYRHTVAWHGQMSGALRDRHNATTLDGSYDYGSLTRTGGVAAATAAAGPDPDDLLYALAQKQRDFATVLARRAAVRKRLADWARAVKVGLNRCSLIEQSSLWPWDKVFDPADLTQGDDLMRYYGRSVDDAFVVRPPASMAAMIPANTGVLTSPASRYATQVTQAEQWLAVNPTDVLGLQTLSTVASWVAADQAPGGDPAPEAEPAPGDESASPEADAGACASYLAPDQLPDVRRFECNGAIPASVCAPAMAEAVAVKMREIDEQEIEPAFDQVAPYGCLDVDSGFAQASTTLGGQASSQVSPCDWNPEMFVLEMANQFTGEREQEYQECVNATGGVFRPGSLILSPGTGSDPVATAERSERLKKRFGSGVDFGCEGPPAGSPCLPAYNDSTEHVWAFIKLYEEWLKDVPLEDDPKTGRPIPGNSSSDANEIGNSTFGVDYDYHAEWRLLSLPAPGQAAIAENFCAVGLRAEAGASARGKVFGETLDLLNASASVAIEREGEAKTPTARSTLIFEVFGQDILAPAGISSDTQGDPQAEIGMEFGLSKEVGDSQTLLSFTIPVAGIPVTVRAGVAGRIGFNFQAAAKVAASCPGLTTSLEGTIEPFAAMDAFVSGGVNLAIVEIGLQVDLTILRVGLPLALHFQISPDPATADLMIHARPELKLALTTLAGRIRAYVRPIFASNFYFPIFEWQGLSVPGAILFNPQWDYPLRRIAGRVGL